MFLNEYEDKEIIRDLIIQHLRNIGIKYRLKKQVLKHTTTKQVESYVFKTPLHLLPVNTVLMAGVRLEVPLFVIEACSAISSNLQVEGLFRKAGSNVRQKEIRQTLDNGGDLGNNHHVIDVANILKLFFRELPEPLIPYSYHDLFLHCLRIKDKTIQSILLVCLLLPIQHLNTLMYFMKFLKQVASNSNENKMDVNNLAIIITPSIMPVEDNVKISNHSNRLKHHVEVIKILIENSQYIALVPDCILEKLSLYIAQSNEELNHLDEEKKKKKKRRSGSLTRMLNGLKKIMSGKSSPDEEAVKINFFDVPDSLSTPCLTKSAKKRKGNETNGFSSKKKREVLQTLPQNSALSNTPFTPVMKNNNSSETPVCAPEKSHEHFSVKRSYLALSNRRLKNKQASLQEESSSAFSRLERRLSLVSNAANWGKKKRKSDLKETSMMDDNLNENNKSDCQVNISQQYSVQSSELDYVRIPKSEYEEIKSRVSAIETRISQEFNNIVTFDQTLSKAVTEKSLTSRAEEVQSEYEKTLEEAESLNDTSTNQLAKRLSRELKIRRSSEQKVIRSPSARKIGTIRRRSREFDKKQNSRLTRNRSWHIMQKTDMNENHNFQKSALRRGRPNTIFTGLPQPSPKLICQDIPLLSIPVSNNHLNVMESSDQSSPRSSYINVSSTDPSTNDTNHQSLKVSFGNITKCSINRASSFHSGDGWNNTKFAFNNSNLSEKNILLNNLNQITTNLNAENWQSAERFFDISKQNTSSLTRNLHERSSLAKLRSQNAGMVLAKTKLFDGLSDSSDASKSSQNNSSKRERNTVIRSSRNTVVQNRNNRRPSSKFPRSSMINSQSKQNCSILGKNCTPRRKQGLKSPNSVQKQHKLKLLKQKNGFNGDQLKASDDREKNCLEYNKENTCKTTPTVADKISVSPLKDCNRLDKIPSSPNTASLILSTPKTTPRIKKPLGNRSPRYFARTPQRFYERKGQTPVKAVHDIPISSLSCVKRRSPRLLLLHSRHVSSAC